MVISHKKLSNGAFCLREVFLLFKNLKALAVRGTLLIQ